MIFQDRQDAGRRLAKALSAYKEKPDTVVLGLPRGGVVVASEVAADLRLPLDIIAVRKIGAPHNPDLAIGAVTEDGKVILDYPMIATYGISPRYIEQEIEKKRKEVKRKSKLYRGDQPELDLQNKTVLLIDDGIATGATMRAAIISAKDKKASKIMVAAPVAAFDTLKKISRETAEIVVLEVPTSFMAVGQFYRHFPQNSDDEIMATMRLEK